MTNISIYIQKINGYKYILVVCDYFTKYTEAYPLKDKTARSVADALMDIWLPRYGFPMFLHSDQGKEFDNTMIHNLSELLGTVNAKTTPYHPRSDGLVEEQFQTWPQIITDRILSDTAFKHALLDSAGSPLCDPDEPVYATALTSARKMCVEQKLLSWPTWITLPTRVTRGHVRA